MEKNKLLEMKSVFAGYHDNLVLKDINLKIYEQDFIGIIGPNGGGKTTLLKVLLGLLTPFKGELRLTGENCNIGYLPQFKVMDNQFPIKVLDVVLSGLMSKRSIFRSFKKKEKERAFETLEKFGVLHLQDKAIGELSGGQVQRVYLSRALISKPQMLVLDEPSAFVDEDFSNNLNDILKELNSEMTILLVSHDIGTILAAVKSIACVNGTLHYHNSSEFSKELIEEYKCSFRMLGHGEIPHTVLKKHGD
jgi:zinc transport system ATP-binding protein